MEVCLTPSTSEYYDLRKRLTRQNRSKLEQKIKIGELIMADPLRWGVLGAAGIARVAVIPAILNSGNSRLAALASRNPDGAKEYAQSIGIDHVFSSYEALLADPDIDAVYIPLPNSLHGEWTLKAAEAGKAVLCEKPMALSAEEAKTIVDACARLGTPLMEGFMYQFHPQHARVRSIIEEGAIGDIVEVQAHLSVDIMNPPNKNNVRFNPELGGGALLDMGCYTIHIARSVFGSEPLSVLGRCKIDPDFGVDIAASGTLEFADGRTATVSCSFEGNGQGFYRVIGRRGLIDVPRAIIPGLDGRIAETLITIVDATGAQRTEKLAAVDQYQLMIEAFADAVSNRTRLPVDPNLSIRNLAVMDAFAASAQTGRTVPVKKV
jgi:xylose dehydrogenase (NAD/NADP)